MGFRIRKDIVNKKICLSVLLCVLSLEAYGKSIYQCKSASGETSFQDTPCLSNQKTVKEKKVKVNLDYSKLSSKDEFYVNSYMLSEESKSMLVLCKEKNIGISADFEHNLQRYNAIAKYNIDYGKKLFKIGTKQVSPGLLNQYLTQEKERVSKEFKSGSYEFAKRECLERSVFLPMAAANTPNRASGYQEGDLDPEGND